MDRSPHSELRHRAHTPVHRAANRLGPADHQSSHEPRGDARTLRLQQPAQDLFVGLRIPQETQVIGMRPVRGALAVGP